MFLKYKMALCLYKLYNQDFNPIEFSHLNFNQILTGRCSVTMPATHCLFEVRTFKAYIDRVWLNHQTLKTL